VAVNWTNLEQHSETSSLMWQENLRRKPRANCVQIEYLQSYEDFLKNNEYLNFIFVLILSKGNIWHKKWPDKMPSSAHKHILTKHTDSAKIKYLNISCCRLLPCGLSVVEHGPSPSESPCSFFYFTFWDAFCYLHRRFIFHAYVSKENIRTLYEVPGFFPGKTSKELKHVCMFHINVTAKKLLTEQRMEEIRNSDLVYFDWG